jgi:hypothetical protein
VRRISVGLLFGAITFVVACGGGGSSSSPSSSSNSTPIPTANVLPISVNSGPAAPANPYVNGAFASLVICAPGSSTCQTVDNVLIDTGSEGLRLLSSVVTLPLLQETVSGNPVVECVQYADGSFNWGSVKTADVKLAGEQASSMPIQIVGDMASSTIPSNCSTNAMTGSGGTETDTLQTMGANGILGLGPFRQDCGPNCPSSAANLPSGMYLPYYVFPSGGTCQPTAVSLTQQLQNPVWMFSTDNNGVIIELPAIGATGATSVAGSLVFGIGTQSNNNLNGAKVLTLDAAGNFTTTFNNASYDHSFIDSGSNGYFFPNSTNIATCTNTAQFGGGITGFYCPSTTLSLSATNTGLNGVSSSVSFSVANAAPLFSANNGNDFVFDNVAGTNPPPSFDWGLSFFFGRNVFTAIESQPTSAGTGPYFAY